MNHIDIIGRLTADPELKSTPSGVPVCSFTVAVDRPRVKDVADFFRCTAWRQTGEFVSRYFTKGRKIGLGGSMQSHQYEKDGQKVTAWELVVEAVDFCDRKPEGDYRTDDFEPVGVDEGELPF